MSSFRYSISWPSLASSTAGGVVGAIAGGAIGAPLGPVGIWVGKFAGSAITGTVTNKIAKNMIKEDSERMLEIVQRQVEYLAVLFMLTEREVENRAPI